MIWAGDITYLRIREGWMYLVIVMDLYSRRIIGWALNKRISVRLVKRAMQMAINLRPKAGLIFHSDRDSQCTSHSFAKQLKKRKMKASMSGKGACWDNAVVERFFGSLKYKWLLKVIHLTKESMNVVVEANIRYYYQVRIHTTNGNLSPIRFEQSQVKVSCFI